MMISPSEAEMNLSPILPVYWKKKGTFLKEWTTLSPEAIADKTNGWKENFALRLDNYVSIDPDTDAAQELVNQWDADGLLPATVSWRTARGIVRRLYRPIPGTVKMKIDPIELDLRHGTGFCDIIPPSYVVDDAKGIKGVYEWIPGHDPDSIEVAPLPQFVLTYFLEHSIALKTPIHTSATPMPSSDEWIQLWQGAEKGGLNNAIIRLAGRLLARGIPHQEVFEILKIWNIRNNPQVEETDLLKKIMGIDKAHLKQLASADRNLADQVRDWVSVTSGEFMVTNCYQDLGVVTVSDKATVRQNLLRLTESGTLAKCGKKRGCYRLIEADSPLIDFINADISQVYDLRFPFDLQNYVNIYPKNVIVVAGASNAGKTAFMLNVVRMNMDRHKIEYFSSEMGPEEMKLRLLKFDDLRLKDWKFHPRERSTNFADAIVPDSINIIDYLEVNKDFYEVGGEIRGIFERLNKGVAIIAIQKKTGVDTGRGGEFTLEKPRLYLAMDSGTIKIVKGKNWANNEINPNGLSWTFKLVQGCKFIETGGNLYDL
jgi:hypothetical protein